MRANLIGPSVNNFANLGRMLNCYREPVAGGFQVRAAPGLVLFADPGRKYPRAATVFDAEVLLAFDGRLTRFNSAGTVSDIGPILPGAAVSIARNGNYAAIVANGEYYTWDGAALEKVTPGAAYVAGSVATIGPYTAVTQLGGRVIQWSNIADATTFNPLNFASAEMTEDPIVRAIAHSGQLFVFKENFLERWTLTGVAGADIARIPGGDEPIGLAAFNLVCSFAGGMAFVSSRGNVILYGSGAISPPQVNDAIAAETPAGLVYYDWAGHGFLSLTFPSGSAWVYDLATGEWHERDAWPVRTAVAAFGKWLLCCEDGKVARLDSICTNFGEPMVRTMISAPLEKGGNLFPLSLVRAYPRTGMDTQTSSEPFALENTLQDANGVLGQNGRPLGIVGGTSLATMDIIADSVGAPAQNGDNLGSFRFEASPAVIELATSRDGRNWSANKPREVGSRGNYRLQVTWRNLGEFRKGYLRFRLSGTSDVPMMAVVDLE